MYVITKSHAKNQLIWTKNWREMAVWSFFWWLVAGLTKITTPRRPGRGLKPSKMDSPCQKTPSLTPQPSLNSLWGRNGEKLYFRWCWWSFCWWLVAWLIKIYNQPSPLPTGHSAPWGRPDREKCRIIGFDTCRVHFWGFQTSPTPSSGQKVQKRAFLSENWSPRYLRK